MPPTAISPGISKLVDLVFVLEFNCDRAAVPEFSTCDIEGRGILRSSGAGPGGRPAGLPVPRSPGNSKPGRSFRSPWFGARLGIWNSVGRCCWRRGTLQCGRLWHDPLLGNRHRRPGRRRSRSGRRGEGETGRGFDNESRLTGGADDSPPDKLGIPNLDLSLAARAFRLEQQFFFFVVRVGSGHTESPVANEPADAGE